MPDTTLTCTKCAAVLPVDQFDRSKMHPARGGRHPWCKACRKANAAARWKANAPAMHAKNEAYRKGNPDKIKAREHAYYLENRTAFFQRGTEWRKANPKKSAEYLRKWRAKDPEKAKRIERAIAKKRQPRKNETSQAWRRRNPEKIRLMVRINGHKYRAKKRGNAIGDRVAYKAFVTSARDAKRIACYWCGKNVPKGKRHIDHIIPISRGGADDVHNICVSCKTCNLCKRNKMPEAFSGQFELAFCPVHN